MSQFHFLKETLRRLLLKGPDGHWGSRQNTLQDCLFFWGYIFSEYGMNRKNSISQPNATSVTFHSFMHGQKRHLARITEPSNNDYDKDHITWYWCRNIRDNMVEKRVKKSGQGSPPLPFRAMPERNRFILCEVFP